MPLRLKTPSAPIEWENIKNIDWTEYQEGTVPENDLDPLIDSALTFIVNEDDDHFSEPKYTASLTTFFKYLLTRLDKESWKTYDECDKLRANLEEAKNTAEIVDRELKGAEEARAASEGIADTFRKTAEQAQRDKERHDAELAEKSKEIKKLKKEVERTVSEKNEQVTMLMRKERELADEKRTRNAQEKGHSRQETEHSHIVKEHSGLVHKYKQVDAELKELQQHYQELQENASKMKEHNDITVKELSDQVEGMKQQILETAQSKDDTMELVYERERQAKEHMDELKNLYKDLLDAETTKVTELQDELNNLQENILANTTTSMAWNPRGMSNAADEEEIHALREEVARLKAQGGSSFAMGGGPSFALDLPAVRMLTDQNNTLVLQVEQLRSDLSLKETTNEAQEYEIAKLRQIRKEYESEDKGLATLQKKVIDGQRSVEELLDDNGQLRERVSMMDDIVSYCNSLKELCKKLGVTEEELTKLNSYGAKAETETLRSEVACLQEELEWCERERKHWMHKVRLQPLMDTTLRLQLGLTMEQLQQLDHLVEKMKSGHLIVEGFHRPGSDHLEYPADSEGVEGETRWMENGEVKDYREAYQRERNQRKQEADTFRTILNEHLGVDLAVVNARQAQVGEGGELGVPQQQARGLAMGHSSAAVVTPEQLAALQQQLNLVGGADLEYTIKQQTEELRSQGLKITELHRDLQQRFSETATLEAQRQQAEADAAEALDERDAYREALGRAGGGASQYDDVVVVDTPKSAKRTAVGPSHFPRPSSGNSLMIDSSSTQPIGATGRQPSALSRSMMLTQGGGSMTLGQMGPQMSSSTALESFVAVESMLRDQLATKTRTIKQLETDKQALLLAREKAEGELKESTEARTFLASQHDELKTHVKSLTESLQETNHKCQDFERENGDLKHVIQKPEMDHHKELLTKVVLLRQREAKLMGRLRLTLAERDTSLEQRDLAQKELEATLKNLNIAMGGSTTNATKHANATNAGGSELPSAAAAPLDVSVVFPSKSGSTKEELRLLETFNKNLKKLRGGIRSQADEKYALNLRLLEESRLQQRQETSLQAHLNQTKRELEMAQVQVTVLQTQVDNAPTTASQDSSLPHANTASLEVDLETYKSKCAIYLKQLSDKDSTIAMITSRMDSATNDLAKAQGDLATERMKNIGGGELGTDDGNASSSAGTTAQQHREAAINADRLLELQRNEEEISRVKTINVGLLQSLMDAQAEKHVIQAQLEGAQHQANLLIEAAKGGNNDQGLSELMSTALRDNTSMKQQLVLTKHAAKKAKIELHTAQHNIRVKDHECTAYRLGAVRVFEKYVEDAGAMSQHCADIQRQLDACLSHRLASYLHEHSKDAFDRSDAVASKLVVSTATAQELQSHNLSLTRELELLRSAGAEHMRDADKQLIVELGSKVRNAERRANEAEEELIYIRSKLTRSDKYSASLVEDVVRLERSACGLFGEQTSEPFLTKLQELKESVVLRAAHGAASTAEGAAEGNSSGALFMRAANASTVKMSAEDAEAAEAIEGYREAVDKQFTLGKQVTDLQRQLSAAKQQLGMSETRASSYREELSRAEHRAIEGSRSLDDERAKHRQQEERMQRAHAEQKDVSQRAAEHNSECLRGLIQAKERTIEQLQEQLKVQRARHLESALMDSNRMERLHEQLYKENNTMMERFKATIETIGTSSPAPGASGNGGLDPNAVGNDAAVRQAQFLTQEVLELRTQVKELKVRNSMLEQQLDNNVTRSQNDFKDRIEVANKENQQLGVKAAVANAEGQLMSLTADQAALVDQLRRREQDLLYELSKANRQSSELLAQVERLEKVEPGSSATNNIGTSPHAGATTTSTAAGGTPLATPSHQSAVTAALPETLEERAKVQEELYQLRHKNAELETELELAKSARQRDEAVKTRLESETVDFKATIEKLTGEVKSQEAEVAKARTLKNQNEELSVKLTGMTEVHDKLVAATNFLRTKLIESNQVKKNDDKNRAEEQGIANRLATLQAESKQQLDALKSRVELITKELNKKVVREEELLKQTEEAKRNQLLQREQVIEREAVVAQLKRQVVSIRTENEKNNTQLVTAMTLLDSTKEELAVLKKKKEKLKPAVATTQSQTDPTSYGPVALLLPGSPGPAVNPAPPVNGTTPTAASAILSTDTSPPVPPTTPPTPATPAGPLGAVGTSTNSLPPRAPATPGAGASSPVPNKVALATIGVQCDIKESPAQVTATLALTGSSIAKQLREKQAENETNLRTVQNEKRKLQQEVDELQKKLADLANTGSGSTAADSKKPENRTRDAQIKSLSEQLSSLKAAKEKMELSHKEEMLEFLEERRAARDHQSDVHRNETNTSVRNLRITNRATQQQLEEVKGTVEKERLAHQRQLQQVNDQLKEAKKEVEKVKAERPLLSGRRSTPSTRGASRKQETMGTQTDATEQTAALARMPPTAGTTTTTAAGSPAAHPSSQPSAEVMAATASAVAPSAPKPRDLASHKLELIKLEAVVDGLQREIKVDKATEILRLTHELERVKKDNLVLSLAAQTPAVPATGESTSSAIPAPAPPAAAPAPPAAAPAATSTNVGPDGLPVPTTAQVREVEDKLLRTEGTVLDLRFEREYLTMKAERLGRHLSDLIEGIMTGNNSTVANMVVSLGGGGTTSASGNGGATMAGNAGFSPSRAQRGGVQSSSTPAHAATMQGASEARSRSGTAVATLEGVIDQMKRVITRLQKENIQLKDTAVHSSKYVETVRENKTLRLRERDLTMVVQQLTQKVAQLEVASRSAENTTGLQRRLRSAQNAAEQYQTELSQLKKQLGNGPAATALLMHNQQRVDAQESTTGGVAGTSFTTQRTQVPPVQPPHKAPYTLAYDVPGGSTLAGVHGVDGVENHRFEHHHQMQHQPTVAGPNVQSTFYPSASAVAGLTTTAGASMRQQQQQPSALPQQQVPTMSTVPTQVTQQQMHAPPQQQHVAMRQPLATTVPAQTQPQPQPTVGFHLDPSPHKAQIQQPMAGPNAPHTVI